MSDAAYCAIRSIGVLGFKFLNFFFWSFSRVKYEVHTMNSTEKQKEVEEIVVAHQVLKTAIWEHYQYANRPREGELKGLRSV